jgi:mannosyltransferase OCH1-like enzyme
MQSWRDFNPDYSFAVHNDTSARDFMAARFPPAVLQAYRRAREPAQQADIFRLAYLAAAGGIYADVHDRCIAGLSRIVPDDARLVMYQEDMGTLGSNFIAAAPAQPVLLTALELAVNAINRGDRDIGWLATGPALLTRALAQVLAARDARAMPAGVLVLERHELFAAVAVHCAANYLRAGRQL